MQKTIGHLHAGGFVTRYLIVPHQAKFNPIEARLTCRTSRVPPSAGDKEVPRSGHRNDVVLVYLLYDEPSSSSKAPEAHHSSTRR